MYAVNTLAIQASIMKPQRPPNACLELPHRAKFRPRVQAFSLIEVVLAIGIVAFAFVALIGLLPAGLANFRKAMNTSVGSEIGQRVFGDLQQSDFDSLLSETVPSLSSKESANQAPQTPTASPGVGSVGFLPRRYFDDQGNEVILQNSTPVGTLPPDPTPAQRATNHILYDVHTQVVLKPQIPSGTNSVILSSNLANVIVQVASNPGGLTLSDSLSTDPAHPEKVQFIEYSGLISRNSKPNTTGS